MDNIPTITSQKPSIRKPYAIIAIAVVFFLIIATAGYFIWQSQKQKTEEDKLQGLKEVQQQTEQQAGQSAIEVPESPVKGKIPELNPIEIVNPFTKTYQNPFK